MHPTRHTAGIKFNLKLTFSEKFIMAQASTQFIYSNRDVYIAIALCSSLLHSAIAM
jgi:hypothetical protein